MALDSEPQARSGSVRASSDLERRYPVALGLFVILGILVWFTVGEGSIQVFGRPVEIRLITLLVIGSFALRTVLTRKADQIRHRGDEGGN
jgi:hypothetical protein